MNCYIASTCSLLLFMREDCASDGVGRMASTAVHSWEFASHPCVHTTTLRSSSDVDPAFFNTLFVSLGIASPPSSQSPPSSDHSPPCPECVPTGRVLSDPWRSRRVSTIGPPDRPFVLVVRFTLEEPTTPSTKRIQAYVPTRWRHVLSVHPPINRRTGDNPGSTMFDGFWSLDICKALQG